MYAIKLTLLMLGVLLYVAAAACWFFWIGPCLLMDGESANILGAFAGTCIWLLITFGMVIHIIKAARPTAGGGR
ncbi:hypothetical protein [Pseudomonas antarctica]|uniref:hypothetical protein n=1 Tax=Pseudomonas antarctica TaxID=219572 RepID=UPI00345CADF0